MDEQLTGSQAPQSPLPWSSIEDTLNRLSALAHRSIVADEYYAELLDELRRAVGAEAAAIWAWTSADRLEILHEDESSTAEFTGRTYHARQHAVDATLQVGEPRFINATDGALLPGGVDATLPATLLVPIISDSRSADRPVLVELVFKSSPSPAERKPRIPVAEAFGAVAADFADREELRCLQHEQSVQGRRDQFLQQLYHAGSVLEAAYQIANEARWLLDSDRVSVLARQSTRYRLLAVSGVDVVDRRSQLCRCLESLASTVALTGDTLRYPAAKDTLPPQIDHALQEYLEQSPARRLTLTLLKPPSRAAVTDGESSQPTTVHVSDSAGVCGLLVTEDFHRQTASRTESAGLESIVPHCAIAIEQLLRQERRPLHRISSWLERRSRTKTQNRLIAAMLALVVMTGLLWGVRANFQIPARGTLQPADRREVFARSNGIVRSVHVAHGDAVTEGQLLVTIEDPELELRASQVLGELRTAQQQLQAVRAKRLNQTVSEVTREEDLQLAAQQQQLVQRIAGLEQQQVILDRQVDELQVRSPIDGTVLTWDLTKRLQNRPVQRGHRLLTVARSAGAWNLEMWIRDKDVAHVIRQQQVAGRELPVSFLLATDSSHTYTGSVSDVSLITEWQDEPEVRVTARIDPDQDVNQRAGATVAARINCGPRSLGYLWLHEFIEKIRTWWF